ncbi:hypothetical protein C8R48DRAFT_678395 [Suillus tomentosus]|nr:hypothetical protein C8R48DRAFT_678395 [Suillus tomentosus]
MYASTALWVYHTVQAFGQLRDLPDDVFGRISEEVSPPVVFLGVVQSGSSHVAASSPTVEKRSSSLYMGNGALSMSSEDSERLVNGEDSVTFRVEIGSCICRPVGSASGSCRLVSVWLRTLSSTGTRSPGVEEEWEIGVRRKSEDVRRKSEDVRRTSEGAGNFGRTFRTGTRQVLSRSRQRKGCKDKVRSRIGPEDRGKDLDRLPELRMSGGVEERRSGGAEERRSGGAELWPREKLPRPEMDIN